MHGIFKEVIFKFVFRTYLYLLVLSVVNYLEKLSISLQAMNIAI